MPKTRAHSTASLKGMAGFIARAAIPARTPSCPSREPQDNLQAIALQGYADTIQECTVCHWTNPGSGGPHHEQ